MKADDRDRVAHRRDALRTEYQEVLSTFRSLTDIRFKLLAFLPIAAAATAAVKGASSDNTRTTIATLGVSAFGLVVTVALVSYNARNDQLYDELVGRAASIERSLGLPDGYFANRPASWFSVRLPFRRQWAVDHRSGVAWIYGASLTLWLFLILFSIVELGYGHRTPDWWAAVCVLVLAGATITAAVRRVVTQYEIRRQAMRSAATRAVKLANRGSANAAQNREFQTLCAGLGDKDVAASREFWELVKAHEQERNVSCSCGEPKWATKGAKRARGPNEKAADAVRKVAKRARYYAKLDDPKREDLRRRYGLEPPEATPSREAYFVGLVSDLPPRWIDDVVTGRA